jgi:hypothetical protein
MVDDWVFSFMDFDREMTDEKSSKPEALPPLPVEPHSKHPLPPVFLFTVNHLKVMMSEEDKIEEWSTIAKNTIYDDVAMGIDEEDDDERTFHLGWIFDYIRLGLVYVSRLSMPIESAR